MVAPLDSSSSSNKRQRTSLLSPPTATANDLTSDIWCGIADFLPSKTSRALLAVALTAPSESWRASGWKGQPSAVSKAIISSTNAGASYDAIVGELYTTTGSHDEAEIKKRFSYCNDDPVKKCIQGAVMHQLKEYYDAQWEILDFADIDSS
jgi:hypothetical protein